MKTIEVENDVYEYLLKNASEIGESASKILKRLLGISGKPIKCGGPDSIPMELSEFLNGTAFKAQPDVIGKFLYLLSYIYQRDRERFEKKVLPIRFGKRRKYFAESKREIEQSGRSTYPQQIPNSPVWVVTNNDTPKKRRMLQDVLKILEYSDDAVKQAVGALA